MPPQAVAALTSALADDDEARISVIWALGSSGNPEVVAQLQPLLESGDPGIRKMVVYALGALPGDSQVEALKTALVDQAADVRWNAAVALARHGSHDGVPVLRQMLDREHVEQVVRRETNPYEDQDPVADVMISGLKAAAALKEGSLRASVEQLSHDDRSMKVRQAALDALKTMS
jgi:HEAT repeat protein